MLSVLQSAFGAALFDRSRPTPAGLAARHGMGSERRYAVHRDNVLFSLIEALRSRFPVAARITGEDFFREVARRFVLQSPPRSPVLLHYGDGLPDFVARLSEADEMPYLPDVLRLECAWSQSYHAADAEPVGADALASLRPAHLADTRVILHPSMRLLRSAFPVVAIWAMNQDGAVVGPIADWSGEDALVVRPRLDVDVVRLPPGGFAFLDALRAGRGLADAIDTALAASDDFDPAPALAGLVSAGLAIRFEG